VDVDPQLAVGRFEGTTCLVTGGGRGIGRAVAEALAAEGASVGVLARTRTQCEGVAAKLGDRALALAVDVTDPDACRRAVVELTDRFGPVTALVNAAGISPVRERAERHEPAMFESILRVNVVGAHVVARAVWASLQAHGGSVVNVASSLGTGASPRLAAYGASKAALIQLTRTLAREWAPHGIRVNAVCPGYVETEMTSAMLAVDRLRSEVLAQTPLARLARLDEVVAPIVFLLSDDASYVTGAALLVDGGMAA
jgi:NAD(P)-dependent dehydrogenase (short-subunit alcohol dehydrogenase family)